MSINREYIRSMKQVSTKIHALTYKIGHLGLSPNVLSTGTGSTTAKVLDYDARLVVKENAIIAAANAYETTEVLLPPAIAKLSMFSSHFFTGIINGTKRGHFALNDRTTVGLNLGNDKYPAMETFAEILAAGKGIVDNDHLRVDAIAKPMALPSKIEVQAVYDDALLVSNDNHNFMEGLNTANREYMALLDEGIALCNKSDNEIETHFDDGDKAAMRSSSTLWGVGYHSSTPIAFLDLTALADGSVVGLEHIKFLVEPGNEEGESDGQGFSRLNIHHFGPIVIHYTSLLYNDGSISLTIGENETVVRSIFLTLRP